MSGRQTRQQREEEEEEVARLREPVSRADFEVLETAAFESTAAVILLRVWKLTCKRAQRK